MHDVTVPGMTKALSKKFDGDSETLATVAARCRNPKVVTLLHEAGVDLNQVNFSGGSPAELKKKK